MDQVKVSIDTAFEKVLEYDADDKHLIFEPDSDDWPEYSDEQIRQLGSFNRGAYLAMKSWRDNSKRIEKAGVASTPGLRISGRLASASSKLDVKYKDGWRDKWWPVWKRADEAEACTGDGYAMVTQDEVERVFSVNPAGYVTIGSQGFDELVLMKEPMDQHHERMRISEELSRTLNEGVEEGTKQDIEASGGKAFTPPAGQDGRNWSSTRDSDVDKVS